MLYGQYAGHIQTMPNILSFKKIPWLSAFMHHDLFVLLFPPSENHPPLEEQLYLFMKRFKTQPSEFFSMDLDTRKWIFDREYELVKAEAKEADRLKKQAEEQKNKN